MTPDNTCSCRVKNYTPTHAGTFTFYDSNWTSVVDEGDDAVNTSDEFFSQSSSYISKEVEENFRLLDPRNKDAWTERVRSQWSGIPVDQIGWRSFLDLAHFSASLGDLKAFDKSLNGIRMYAWLWDFDASDLLETAIDNCLVEQKKAASLAYQVNDLPAFDDAVENLRLAHLRADLYFFDETHYQKLREALIYSPIR